MTPESRKKILWVTLFAITMGWFETAVVVYLRTLYFPEGFSFPLKVIPGSVGMVELVREAASLLMILSVAVLAGRNRLERFGYFMFIFGVWDIIYYIGLKLSLNWPASLMTWDLLFLLPLPWIGPVLAPVLVSLGLIGACIVIVIAEDQAKPLNPPLTFWLLEILCGLIIIFSFIIDYKVAFSSGVPERFRWEIFLIGYLPGLILFFLAWRKRS
ncbi:hypothetical protein K8I28_17020 [bacterium]|nr:hypothetical protein [bacterium]